MKKTRLTMLILMVCAVMLVMAACGGNSGNNGKTNSGNSGDSNQQDKQADPVTISFVFPSTNDTSTYTKIFDEFEKQTGNKVELQPLPGGAEYDGMVKTRFTTGDYPDLVFMQPGTKQYLKLKAEETLHDWTGNPDILNRLQDSLREYQELDGHIYGIPWGSTGMYGVFYNKQIFNDVGVDVPQNYADLLNIAQKVKDAGYTPFYEAVKDAWPAQIFYLSGWVSKIDPVIGAEGVQELETNQMKLTDIAELRTLFERHLELKDKGYLQDNLLAGTYDEAQNLIGENQVAMIFMLDGILPQLNQKFGEDFVRENIGFFPYPGDDNTGNVMITQPNQLMVPKDAKHRDAAIQLVDFMTSPKMVELWYGEQPGIPIFKDATSELYPAQETVQQYINEGKAIVNIQNRLTASFNEFAKTLQNLFINGNIDEAIQAFSDNYVRDGESKRLEGF